MKVGTYSPQARTRAESIDELLEYEAIGVDRVTSGEAYTFDVVSQLGYLAALTTTMEIASSIINVFTRSPTLIAATAASLDDLSGGRFALGLGASGPQVIEGFFGVSYDSPLGRTREVIEICRKVWRREVIDYDGKYFHIPLTPEHGGGGLGKPLRLINHPLRDDIPIVLAALGPKNIELAAELCQGWEPIFYIPERADMAFGDALAAGYAKRDPALGEMQVIAQTRVCVTEDPQEHERAVQAAREHLALYIGGMGAKGKNFYNDLAIRYGYDEATEIQELYLSGKRAEAVAAVPLELVHGSALIGTAEHVAERVAAFAAAGVTTLQATALSRDRAGRVRSLSVLKQAGL